MIKTISEKGDRKWQYNSPNSNLFALLNMAKVDKMYKYNTLIIIDNIISIEFNGNFQFCLCFW